MCYAIIIKSNSVYHWTDKIIMQMNCLFVCVALVLVSISSAEYQWSGFVNNVEEDFDFMCPDNLAITGIASQFKYVA